MIGNSDPDDPGWQKLEHPNLGGLGDGGCPIVYPTSDMLLLLLLLLLLLSLHVFQDNWIVHQQIVCDLPVLIETSPAIQHKYSDTMSNNKPGILYN